jgi:hypothetical protein
LAVRDVHPEELAAVLGLKRIRRLPWKEGIDAAYERNARGVFVSPAVSRWTLVIGHKIASAEDNQFNPSFRATLETLSQRFGEAQAFGTHRVIEYHLWMLAKNGQLLRSFEYIGERGEILDDFGTRTPVEQDLSFFEEPREEWFPSESDVMQVAGAWSLDPTKLTAESGPAEYGLFGEPSNQPG